jgi:uncharacterized protein (TIGR02145 family)
MTITPITMTDATGCPGHFCKYIGRDLYIDDTHKCDLRTGGAQNWEAWIKDARDYEYYRIVFMPDNNWWLAQNVKLASYNSSTVGSAISGCTKDECGRCYTWAQVYASYAGGSSGSSGNVQGICPPGWLLPIQATFASLATSINTDAAVVTENLRPLDANCQPASDGYGWASIKGVRNGSLANKAWGAWWYANDQGREDGFIIDTQGCRAYDTKDVGEAGEYGVVRCYRQL